MYYPIFTGTGVWGFATWTNQYKRRIPVEQDVSVCGLKSATSARSRSEERVLQRQRWRRTLQSRLAGAGFKRPMLLSSNSDGGERYGKGL